MSTTYNGFSIGEKVLVAVNHGGFAREYQGDTGVVMGFDEGDSLDVRVQFPDGCSDWGRTTELRPAIPTLQGLEALRAELARAEAAYADDHVGRTITTIEDNKRKLVELFEETQRLAQTIGKTFEYHSGYEEFALEDREERNNWDSSSANC